MTLIICLMQSVIALTSPNGDEPCLSPPSPQYVAMFACAYPYAGALALLSNLIESYADALKLCTVHQRPLPQHATSGLGPWRAALEAVSYLSVVTNCLLMAVSARQSRALAWLVPDDLKLLLGFVALEHALLALKAVLATVLPA